MEKAFPLSLEEALTAYEQVFLAGRNLAPRTRKEYLTDLDQLVEHLTGVSGVQTVQAVERRHLEGFLATLDGRQLTGATRRRKVAAIRSFFLFVEDAGYRTGNPAQRLVPPEREWKQPRYLTEAEYKRLLAAVQHEVRDGAIIELLLQTGLRLSELARLELLDVELPARISKEPGCVGSVRVQGKGRGCPESRRS